MTKLINPYPSRIDPTNTDRHRLNLDISRSDVMTIRAVDLDDGTLTIACKLFIKFLANECKSQNFNINNTNADKFYDLITQRCTPTSQVSGGDERHGANGVCDDGQKPENVPTTRKRKQTTTRKEGSVQGVGSHEHTKG